MLNTLWVAKTGLEAQDFRMGVISNNLANAGTTAFKRDSAEFQDLIYQTVRQAGTETAADSTRPKGLMKGTGVAVVGTSKVFTQGEMKETGSAWEVAIQGRGFFQVMLPDGTIGYTRNGTFSPDAVKSELVSSQGFSLEPAIALPAADTYSSVSISAGGMVQFLDSASAVVAEEGPIQLALFSNPGGLSPSGGGIYRETVSSGTATVGTPSTGVFGSLMSGFVEASNVNTVEEMVNMIEAQRGFEMNSKAISKADEMLSTLTQRM